MPAPVVKVEFAPGYSANDPAPSWLDISSYVRLEDGITFNRGRQDEVSQVTAGSLQITLNNDDGRFTPGYVSGVYGVLRVGCQIRVSVGTVAGYDTATLYDSSTPYDSGTVFVPQWTGNITDYGNGFTNGYRPVARVQAIDKYALLSLKKLRSMYEEEVFLAEPVAFYPLADPTGSTQANETSGIGLASLVQRVVGAGGTIDFGVANAIDQQELTAASFSYTKPSGTVTGFRQLVGKCPVSSGDWSVGAWVAMTPTPTNTEIDTAVVAIRTNGNINNILAEGFPYTGLMVFSGQFGSYTAGATINDGKWHHIAATYTSSTNTVRYYKDGVLVVTETAAWTAINSQVGIQIGGYTDETTGLLTPLKPFMGNIFGVAFYSRVLTAGEVLAHYRSGTFAAVDSRLRRLSAFSTGVEVTVNGTAGPYVSYQATTGSSVAQAMGDAAQVSGAVLYLDGYGQLEANQPDMRYNSVPALSLSPAMVNAEVEWLTNNAYLVNDATVTGNSGRPLRSRSTVSQASVGAYTQQISLPFYDDDDAYQYAASLVAAKENKVVQPRVSTLTVDVMTKQASVTAVGVLNRDIGDKIRIRDLPTGSPAPWFDVFIEGISQSITTNTHTVTWATSPVLVTDTVQVLDNSTYGCVMEQDDAYSLTSDITSSQTSISITSTSTVNLSTAAGDYPLSILIGDEVLQITAAPAGSTSPQVVTVTRNVDPSSSPNWPTATRNWPAGTKVSLFNDPRIALV